MMGVWNGLRRTPMKPGIVWRRTKKTHRGVAANTKKAVWDRDGECAYRFGGGCDYIRDADHVVPRSKFVTHPALAAALGYPADYVDNLVAACRNHNAAKGARLLIPRAHAHRLDEYNTLNIGVFRVWDGDAAALREVVR